MSDWYKTHNFSQLALNLETSLPDLSVIALDHLALVDAVGADAVHYLQGQLTCDLISLPKNQSTLAAHCDAKGKVWSVLRVFHHLDGIAYTQPRSVCERQLTEIRKYSVFSKVDFLQSDFVLLGVAGQNADQFVESRFSTYPVHDEENTDLDAQTVKSYVRTTRTGTAVKIEQNRWMLALAPSEADAVLHDLDDQAVLASHQLWDLYELRAGITQITEATTHNFIPQALNLQHLDAISFKKGCYAGQEMVARAKYRGMNKRATYLLQGKAEKAPQAGDEFDRDVGGHWRVGGTVLNGFRFEDGNALALVVLPNDLDENCAFRPSNTETIWHKTALPYSLDDEL